jgi:DNA mismatch endonuclease (patch repair protein)
MCKKVIKRHVCSRAISSASGEWSIFLRMALTVTERMKRVRQADTWPELAVRRALHGAGLRYRVCERDLPGKPDIANKSGRWAVFVHGCYWHGHHNCSLATVPKTNKDFWLAKICDNRLRDARKESQLRSQGFAVFVIWECEVRSDIVLGRLIRRLANTSVSR